MKQKIGFYTKQKPFIFAILLVGLFATSCESLGILGQGGVKGSVVKTEILDIATTNNIIIGALIGASPALITLSIIVDDVVVPGLAGISDSAHYTRESVDACKNKMSSIGLIVDTWVGAITCKINKTPALIQIGNQDSKGKLIQIGPIGL